MSHCVKQISTIITTTATNKNDNIIIIKQY